MEWKKSSADGTIPLWSTASFDLRTGVIVVTLHLAILFSATLGLRWVQTGHFDANDLLQFDAAHYGSIAKSGYAGFNMAFFPLFPFLWRITGLGIVGISLLNAVLYSLCVLALAHGRKVTLPAFVAWLLMPSAIFYFVPYSEATFFLGATLLLLGWQRETIWVTVAGLLMCSLARPAFTVVLPAVVIGVLYQRGFSARAFKDVLVLFLTSAAGLAVVAMVQHNDTGEWLGFYTQQRGWGNHFRLPTLPLTSWGGAASTRLDAVAFLVGCGSAFLLVRTLVRRVRDGISHEPTIVISLAYCAGISALVLFFRGGELFSLNRFVFATPFALVLIGSFLQSHTGLGVKKLALAFFVIMAFFQLFAAYVHIRTFIAFAAITLFVMLFLAIPGARRHGPLFFWAWALLTMCLQVFYFLRFLSGGWVA